MEFENPTRRYKWFRPRQAARGTIQSSSINFGTWSLYNDSTGPQLLVVRALAYSIVAGSPALLCLAQQGIVGAAGGKTSPLMSGEAKPPGALYFLDTAVGVVPDFTLATQNVPCVGNGLLPIAILQPGWSFTAQSNQNAANLYVSFLWEAISIDELDFLY